MLERKDADHVQRLFARIDALNHAENMAEDTHRSLIAAAKELQAQIVAHKESINSIQDRAIQRAQAHLDYMKSTQLFQRL